MGNYFSGYIPVKYLKENYTIRRNLLYLMYQFCNYKISQIVKSDVFFYIRQSGIKVFSGRKSGIGLIIKYYDLFLFK